MNRVSNRKMLPTDQVIKLISRAVREKKPFCLVRVGDGENIVMAQSHVIPIEKIVRTRWGQLSRETNSKGIRLPNVEARDQIIKSLKRADIVGIPYYNDKEIQAPQKYLRNLTETCFKVHKIVPKQICHTFVNRHMVEKQKFWEMLRGRKVALITKWANSFAKLIAKEYGDFNIQIVAKIPLSKYEEIEETVRKMKDVQCDLILISAGVNSVILADLLARKQGRVAIDFGKSAMFMINRNRKRVRPWRGEGTP